MENTIAETIEVPKIGAQIEAFKATMPAVLKSAEKCKSIAVTDDQTLAMAQQSIGEANTHLTAAEKLRKKIKAPVTELAKKIDAIFKEVSDPLEEGIGHGKNQILKYNEAQEKIKKDAAAKIEADRLAAQQSVLDEKDRILTIRTRINGISEALQKKIETCSTVEQLQTTINNINEQFPKLIEFQEFSAIALECKTNAIKSCEGKISFLQQKNKVSVEEQAILNQKEQLRLQEEELNRKKLAIAAEEQALAEKKKAEAEASAAEQTRLQAEAELENQGEVSGLRKNWKFEVVNMNDVPADWKIVDEDKVKEFLKNNKEDWKGKEEVITSGIRFYIEKTVTAR